MQNSDGQLSEELFQKYDRPGPRYTSYPPVPFWNRAPSQDEWLKHLSANYSSRDGLDLYIHIPFCQSLCWYCGCFRTITKNKNKGDAYVDYLLKEWGHYQTAIPDIRLHSIHFGGGTPTFLKPQTLKRLLKVFTKDKLNNFIGSIEVDPRTCEPEHLNVLQEFGVKRISMGIQDFDPDVQAAINRHQSFELVKKIVNEVRARHFESINFDLIYGLPRQNWQTVSNTIYKVIELGPDLIAFYSYAHLPDRLKNQRLIKEAELPTGHEKRELYDKGKSLLLEHGYTEVGLDHFAKKDSYLAKAVAQKKLKRNFMGYTDTKTPNLIALGVSAISNTPQSFVQNEKDLKAYFAMLDDEKLPIVKGHVLTKSDRLIDEIIHQLMCNHEVKLPLLQQHPLWHDIVLEIHEMQKDGLVDIKENRLIMTPMGGPFLRNVAMVFDEYLRTAQSENRFSRTI
jgi:oxygen-independent coproporphyrinogen-3 oxidase